jgi:hypothetical protein
MSNLGRLGENDEVADYGINRFPCRHCKALDNLSEREQRGATQSDFNESGVCQMTNSVYYLLLRMNWGILG